MANPEHVEVVKRGSAAILWWRRENPGIRLDLSYASMPGVDLSCSNLTNADLTNANLINANLTGANLTGARMKDVKMDASIVEIETMKGLNTAKGLSGLIAIVADRMRAQELASKS